MKLSEKYVVKIKTMLLKITIHLINRFLLNGFIKY